MATVRRRIAPIRTFAFPHSWPIGCDQAFTHITATRDCYFLLSVSFLSPVFWLRLHLRPSFFCRLVHRDKGVMAASRGGAKKQQLQVGVRVRTLEVSNSKAIISLVYFRLALAHVFIIFRVLFWLQRGQLFTPSHLSIMKF